jgi:hydroxymethylpyrimidine kinase/phosphomethylpyrimidine kinase
MPSRNTALSAQEIFSLLTQVRQAKPLVLNITNFVAMNYCANALLSVGASPIMAHAREETHELVKIAGALVINIGTLDKNWIADMRHALLAAKKMGQPVMVSKSGHQLLQEDAIEALKVHLIPLAEILTPNIREAEVLLNRSIITLEDAAEAAHEIRSMGAQSVLIKGGHLNLPRHSYSELQTLCTDQLASSEGLTNYSLPRVNTPNTHGTGCTLSAAICAFRAKNFSIVESVGLAKSYLTQALVAKANLKLGAGHGPVFHAFDPHEPIGEA